jgi:stalled ribosome rescue protein Dom34
MSIHQSIVWIDGNEARIVRVEDGLHPELTIHLPDPPNAQEQMPRHEGTSDDANVFFRQVARALDTVDEILVVGPSTIKEDFVKYMHKDDHALDPRILGVETIAHPSDRQLAGYARLYFASGGPRRKGNGFKTK